MTSKVLVRCISNDAYLRMGDNGVLREGAYPEEKLGNLTVGRTYWGVVEGEYVRVWDDADEDYLYPRNRFEFVEAP